MLGCRQRCRRHRPGRRPGRGLGAQPVAHLGAQHADHGLHLLVTNREQKGGGAAIPVGRGLGAVVGTCMHTKARSVRRREEVKRPYDFEPST